MKNRSSPILVKISGPFALFTRPEMKVERVSYDLITPSAARGALEAVLWKPAMRWLVERITVLKPIRFLAVKRNEVATKVPSDFVTWARRNEAGRDFFADDDRQQRNALVLRDVEYLVEAVIELTEKAGPEENVIKFVEMFKRRVEKGQHYHQPYLGCREFPASVELAQGDEVPDQELLGHEDDLGWMLHDIEYEAGKPKQPRFFHAVLRDGSVVVPPWEGVAQ
jgi:CRISPR-associated protein Cas5d